MEEFTTRDFLECLYGEKPDNFHIMIWDLAPKAQHGRSFWTKSIEDALKHIENRKTAEVNTYYQVGLSAKNHGPRKRCSTDETENRPVFALPCIFADIDIKGPNHKQNDLPPTLEDAISLVNGHGFDPTIIIDTGNGIQALWVFKELWELYTADDRKAASIYLARFKQCLKDRATKHDWHIDSVQDLVRVLRVPGTWNVKNGDKKPVTIIEFDDDKRYNPGDLEEFFPDYDPDFDSNINAKSVAINDNLVLNPNATPPSGKLKVLCQVEPKFEAVWNCDKAEIDRLGTNDENKPGNNADFSLISHTVRAGWSDQEIADLIITYRRKNGDNPEKSIRNDYLPRSISKVRNTIKSDVAQKYLEDAEDVMDTEYEDTSPEGKEKIRKYISDRLGIDVIKIIKYVKDNPEFELVTSKGSVFMKGASGITNQNSLRNNIMAATNQYMPSFTREVWDNIGRHLARMIIDVHVSPDETSSGKIKSWIQGYLEDKQELNVDSSALSRDPFVHANKWNIYKNSFNNWVMIHKNAHSDEGSISVRLRSVGIDQHNVNVNINKKRTKRSVWEIPVGICEPGKVKNMEDNDQKMEDE